MSFAIPQVVVFRADGSVLLNEMTVNVPHVSGKGHSLVCVTHLTSHVEVYFFRGKSRREVFSTCQIWLHVWTCLFSSDPRDQSL